MAAPTTLKMSDLIDETLDYLHRYSERPGRVVIGATALTALPSSTQLTLSEGSATVNVSDLLEVDSELLFVTAKSSDATPVFTVARGYLGTVLAAHPTGSVGGLNPLYPRYQVLRALARSLLPLTKLVPNVSSATYTRNLTGQFVELPASTIDVLEVGYMNPSPTDVTAVAANRYTEIGGWEFEADLPASVVASKQLLRVPSWVRSDVSLIIKTQSAYTLQGSGEAATVAVPVGADDLPVLHAAARLVSGREISRSELDKVEEWNHEAAIRGGVNIRLLQFMWSDFYRRVDEVRALQRIPKHRPYRKMARPPQRRPWIAR